MKKSILVMVALCWGTCLLAAGSAVEIRLTAGIGQYQGEDLTRHLAGWNQRTEDLGWAIESRLEFKRRASEFAGDIVFNLSRSVALGVGAGMFQADEDSQLASLHASVRSVIRGRFQADVVPLAAFLVLRLPLGKKAQLSLSGGAGLHRCRLKWIENRNTVEDAWEAEKNNALGYRGSLALDVSLLPRLALVLEAYGRYLKLEGLTGARTFQGKTYENNRIWLGQEDGYDTLAVRETMPAADAQHGGWREAFIDLTTIGLRAGVAIRL